jgi:hypothetical protein
MRLQSIIDPKKKKQVLDALKRGDPSLLRKKSSAKPLVDEQKPQDSKQENEDTRQYPDPSNDEEIIAPFRFTIEQNRQIIDSRSYHMDRGATDDQISKRISQDLGIREHRIRMQIRGLVQIGEIPKNPN